MTPGVIHAADIQDRDGAPDVLRAIRHRFGGVRRMRTSLSLPGSAAISRTLSTKPWRGRM
jgi:hypothetical protein